MVEQFKYFGTNLPNQNSVQEEINVDEFRDCSLWFGAESFVFQFATQQYID